MNRSVRILSAVNHERLDDEVIAINLETGVYFAFDDAAAECWSVAAAGGGVEQMTAMLVALYEVDQLTAHNDVQAFVEGLVEAQLAMIVDESPVEIELAPASARRPYLAPVAQGYDDLETLLLIDPIHEVDEAGWPKPPAVELD